LGNSTKNRRHLTIKNLPEELRPRERMLTLGSASLATSELLAIILSTGSAEETAVQLGERLISTYENLSNLLDAEVEEISKLNGIGLAKACRIKAALELGKRLTTETFILKHTVTNPEQVANIFMEQMRYLRREEFRAVYVNVKQQILAAETISVGSLNCSIVHPREVFKPAVKRSASAVILLHNHPSGDPTPSKEDVQVTRRLVEAGKLLGIDLLDHVIIGDGNYISMRERGLI
jgi:DNA repair protein RadC